MGQIYIIINSKLIDWCKWEQIHAAMKAMLCFVSKLNILRVNIIQVLSWKAYLIYLYLAEFVS